MGPELYIYWKVAAAQLGPALRTTQDLQAALPQRHRGLLVGVLQRADAAGTPTLMEIYTLPGGVTPTVQQDIESQAAVHWMPLGAPAPQRHVEVFFPTG